VKLHRSQLSIAVAVGALAAGCNLPDRAPTGFGDPSRVGMNVEATVVALAANAINARVFYVRTTGTRSILIDSTVKIDLDDNGNASWKGTRRFPVEFDLAPCLGDNAHVVAGSGCLVGVAVRLLSNGALLDSIDIAPVQVEPGRVTTVTRTIILREIRSLTVTLPAAAASGVSVGESVPLDVRVVDVSGATLTDRPVAWASSDPLVARVTGAGVVTALSVGEALITASAGAREGSARLLVTGR
jgi:hypothetical protein